MNKVFNDLPEIIENNFKVALKCQFYPKEISPKLPKFINEENFSSQIKIFGIF